METLALVEGCIIIGLAWLAFTNEREIRKLRTRVKLLRDALNPLRKSKRRVQPEVVSIDGEPAAIGRRQTLKPKRKSWEQAKAELESIGQTEEERVAMAAGRFANAN